VFHWQKVAQIETLHTQWLLR